jgi:hypothetical protein
MCSATSQGRSSDSGGSGCASGAFFLLLAISLSLFKILHWWLLIPSCMTLIVLAASPKLRNQIRIS